jgi:DNA-binding NarL/FixJ family response regulator
VGDSKGVASRGEAARILLADDHALIREGLRTMLSGEEGLEVVGEAHDGQQALQACRELRPDLVLMDVRMPEMDGLEATKRIKAEMPRTSVVMVTMHESPDYLLEAVRAGAAGYVLKDASGERLLGAVRRTLEGEFPLDEGLAMRLLTRLATEKETPTGKASAGGAPSSSSGDASAGAPAGAPVGELGGQSGGLAPDREGGLEGLTPREAEVLRLLSRGQTNPQIAQNLLYSVSTVKAHVRSILSKLGVSDRTQAAVRAIEAGMVTPDLD